MCILIKKLEVEHLKGYDLKHRVSYGVEMNFWNCFFESNIKKKVDCNSVEQSQSIREGAARTPVSRFQGSLS